MATLHTTTGSLVLTKYKTITRVLMPCLCDSLDTANTQPVAIAKIRKSLADVYDGLKSLQMWLPDSTDSLKQFFANESLAPHFGVKKNPSNSLMGHFINSQIAHHLETTSCRRPHWRIQRECKTKPLKLALPRFVSRTKPTRGGKVDVYAEDSDACVLIESDDGGRQQGDQVFSHFVERLPLMQHCDQREERYAYVIVLFTVADDINSIMAESDRLYGSLAAFYRQAFVQVPLFFVFPDPGSAGTASRRLKVVQLGTPVGHVPQNRFSCVVHSGNPNTQRVLVPA